MTTQNDGPFDADAYPEEFTVDSVLDLTGFDQERIERHFQELTARQRQSYRDSIDVAMAPIRQAARDAARYRFPGPRKGVPLGPSQELKETADRIAERILRRVDLGVDSGSTTSSGSASLDVRGGIDAAGTVGQLRDEVDRDAEMLKVLQNQFELMQHQHLSSTRGAFLAVIVSLMVIVAGVAPIVSADDWCERLWIIGVSAALGALALGFYLAVRRGQRNSDTPPVQPDS